MMNKKFLYIIIFAAISLICQAQDSDETSPNFDFSLNDLFIRLLKDADPDEAYRYIEIIIDQGEYDINEILFYLCHFTSKEDQLEKESLLLRLLDWFFDSANQVELVEKSLFNGEALNYIISRLPHFKNSSLWIVIIKLGYYVQSQENLRIIDSFITSKINKHKNGKIMDQDYYPVVLAFLKLAEKTGEQIFYYNVESLYYESHSKAIVPLAKKVLKALLKSSDN